MTTLQPKSSLSPSLFSKGTDDWETPTPLYDWLNVSFAFTLDPAATAENTKCDRYFTREDDGLAQSWADERVFLNPPYSGVGAWVQKASHEAAVARATVVLLTAARVDTRWFQDYVLGKANEIQFLPGRVVFGLPGRGGPTPRHSNTAPFPSVVIVFRPPIQRAFMRPSQRRSR